MANSPSTLTADVTSLAGLATGIVTQFVHNPTGQRIALDIISGAALVLPQLIKLVVQHKLAGTLEQLGKDVVADVEKVTTTPAAA